ESTVLRQLAAMVAPPPAGSVRWKTMPLSGAAGRSISDVLAPECRPTPRQWIGFLMVRCWTMFIRDPRHDPRIRVNAPYGCRGVATTASRNKSLFITVYYTRRA